MDVRDGLAVLDRAAQGKSRRGLASIASDPRTGHLLVFWRAPVPAAIAEIEKSVVVELSLVPFSESELLARMDEIDADRAFWKSRGVITWSQSPPCRLVAAQLARLIGGLRPRGVTAS